MSRAGAASFGVAAVVHGVLLLAVPAGWWASRPARRSPQALRLELTLAAPAPVTVASRPAQAASRRSEPAAPARASAQRSVTPRRAAVTRARESPPSSAEAAPASPESGAATLSTSEPGPRGVDDTAGRGSGAARLDAGYRVVSEPSYLTRTQPAYPAQARRLQQEGVVVLTLYISAEGRLDRVEVTKSSGHRSLDEAAVAAERKSRFRPATLGGRPVPCKAEVPYRFELE